MAKHLNRVNHETTRDMYNLLTVTRVVFGGWFLLLLLLALYSWGQGSMENELLSVESGHGQLYCYHNFTYTKDPRNPNLFRCSKRNTEFCTATLIRTENNELILTNAAENDNEGHNHDLTPYLVDRHQLLAEMRLQARTTVLPLYDIFRNVSASNPRAAIYLNYNSIRSTLTNERLKQLPPIPQTVTELAEILDNMPRYRDIYIGSVFAGDAAALLFSNPQLLAGLEESDDIASDATFSAITTKWQALELQDFDPILLDMAICVPLVPHAMFQEAQNALVEKTREIAQDNENVETFVRYMVDTWFRNPRLTSLFGVANRTNNDVEHFNKRATAQLGGRGPNLFLMLDNLRQLIGDELLDLERSRQNFPPRRPPSRAMSQRNSIIASNQSNLVNGRISVAMFLQSLRFANSSLRSRALRETRRNRIVDNGNAVSMMHEPSRLNVDLVIVPANDQNRAPVARGRGRPAGRQNIAAAAAPYARRGRRAAIEPAAPPVAPVAQPNNNFEQLVEQIITATLPRLVPRLNPQLPQEAPEPRNNLCVICLVARSTEAVIPCGHRILCRACKDAFLLDETNQRCPLCRTLFASIVTIFD